jgi:hypothetical protein
MSSLSHVWSNVHDKSYFQKDNIWLGSTLLSEVIWSLCRYQVATLELIKAYEQEQELCVIALKHLLTYMLHVSSSLWRSVDNWSFHVQNFVFLGVKDTDAKTESWRTKFLSQQRWNFCYSTRSWFAFGSCWINVSLNNHVGAF